MDPIVKAKWCEALRSGKYQQGLGRLKSIDDRYCCLGVCVDVVDQSRFVKDEECEYWYVSDPVESLHRRVGSLPLDIAQIAGLDTAVESTLVFMNDNQGRSFKEIADYIEKNL